MPLYCKQTFITKGNFYKEQKTENYIAYLTTYLTYFTFYLHA